MADLEVFLHPLATRGPVGVDETGQEWLNGERAIEWGEAEVWGVQFQEEGRLMEQKDDWVGWLESGDQLPGWYEDEEDTFTFALFQPGFAAERVDTPEMFERPGESYRALNFHQADYRCSLGEGSQLEETHKSGLPLTCVEQYECGIYSRKIYPTIGQEIVLEEDRRILPRILRLLTGAEAQELYDEHGGSIGDMALRWKLSRKGRGGFGFYLRWMQTRRAACRHFFPGLHNLLWYLEATKTWITLGGVSLRGTMSITGLQLVLTELWGPGYILHQREDGSWFRRASIAGPDRILHLTLKCQHTDSSQAEGVEGSRCWMCGMVVRLFEMGYTETSHFCRYIEPQYMADVFEYIYPSACVEFHKQINDITTHLTNCTLHRLQPHDVGLTPREIAHRNRACFSNHDAAVKSSDVALMASARKRLATHTRHERELLLTEGCVLDSDYEQQEPSIDARGEDGCFYWSVNW